MPIYHPTKPNLVKNQVLEEKLNLSPLDLDAKPLTYLLCTQPVIFLPTYMYIIHESKTHIPGQKPNSREEIESSTPPLMQAHLYDPESVFVTQSLEMWPAQN